MRKRVYEILESSTKGDKVSRVFDMFIITLILLNIAAAILETEPALKDYLELFRVFDLVSVGVFTVEYILRIWSSGTLVKYQGFRGKIKYMLSPMALVDLMAILPFYIPMLLPIDLRVMRVFRIIRIFRILKLVRYSQAFKDLGDILKKKKEELVVTLAFLFILLVVASSLMYYAEHDAQPKKYSSIISSM